MGITAALCVGIGVYPEPLYALLPYRVDFAPYTLEHVVTQLQLLMFSALAFTVLIRTGVYPPELRSTNLDTDWLYRRLGYGALRGIDAAANGLWGGLTSLVHRGSQFVQAVALNHHGPDGIFGRSWPTGTMAFWTTVMLGAYLVLSYI